MLGVLGPILATVNISGEVKLAVSITYTVETALPVVENEIHSDSLSLRPM